MFENDVEHQFSDGECGVYSIYFIENMLRRNFIDVIEDVKKDKEIYEYRKKYFRKNIKDYTKKRKKKKKKKKKRNKKTKKTKKR